MLRIIARTREPQEFEDPFLWWQPETSSFHALFHTMGGCRSVIPRCSCDRAHSSIHTQRNPPPCTHSAQFHAQ